MNLADQRRNCISTVVSIAIGVAFQFNNLLLSLLNPVDNRRFDLRNATSDTVIPGDRTDKTILHSCQLMNNFVDLTVSCVSSAARPNASAEDLGLLMLPSLKRVS
ncbi:hypothetical protein [Mycobacterium shimoidei]|uniref:hypothetical protein n=1 Tax=Mycobacterium shimoidei TaxID=29313 RepID=UPI000DEA1F58|nr:hypothetical protein [Mycobacterium shimoidei]